MNFSFRLTFLLSQCVSGRRVRFIGFSLKAYQVIKKRKVKSKTFFDLKQTSFNLLLTHARQPLPAIIYVSEYDLKRLFHCSVGQTNEMRFFHVWTSHLIRLFNWRTSTACSHDILLRLIYNNNKHYLFHSSWWRWDIIHCSVWYLRLSPLSLLTATVFRSFTRLTLCFNG